MRAASVGKYNLACTLRKNGVFKVSSNEENKNDILKKPKYFNHTAG